MIPRDLPVVLRLNCICSVKRNLFYDIMWLNGAIEAECLKKI